MIRKFIYLSGVILFALLSSGFGVTTNAAAAPPPVGAAQSSDPNWTTPVNLSHSGGTSLPQIIAGADGTLHVLWADSFAGNIYTSGNGVEWNQPLAVKLPSGDITPRLIADNAGMIHAFWIDERGYLKYSRVKAENFTQYNTWTRPLQISGSATAFDVAVDATNRLNLTYLQTEELVGFPAGIYYMQASGERYTWTKAVNIYQSPYFRSITAETANIQISTPSSGDGSRVHIAWDNNARERVFTIRSLDSGVTWEQPVEVDAPVDGTVAGGPQHIVLNAEDADNVLLIWQTETSGVVCTQYYQWSQDGGSTWQPRQRMLEDMSGCPAENQIVTGEGGAVFLITSLNNQVYMLAWNGSAWSPPQLQAPLAAFTDPGTFRSVSFACKQPLLAGTSLYVIGCDQGASQDIWVMSRQLSDISTWFEAEPVWSTLTPVTFGQASLYDPILLPDGANSIHAFWIQSDASAPGSPNRTISYARQEGGQWTPPETVLGSPDGITQQPTAVLTPDARLLAAWVGGQTGQVYLSFANVGQAGIGTAWAEPQPITSAQLPATSPELTIDTQGTIYLTYAVPLNESRGIYFMRSTDGGATWSNPVFVFDAAKAGWAMADNPRLAVSASGHLHMVFTRYTIPGSAGPLGLYYTRSQDGGITWSPAQPVVEKPVIWSQVAAVGDKTVHRIWQELSSGRTTLWQEQSLDGGQSWTRIAPVSIFGETVGAPTLAVDTAGRLHLFQVVDKETSGMAPQIFALQHWIYDYINWVPEQSLDIGSTLSSDFKNFTATVTPGGELGVAFTAQTVDAVTGLPQENLFFTSRAITIPEGLSQPAPVGEPAPTLPAVSAATPTISPSPEVTGSITGSLTATPELLGGLVEQPGPPGNTWLGPLIGPVAAGLIVLVVLIVGLRGVRGVRSAHSSRRVGLRRR